MTNEIDQILDAYHSSDLGSMAREAGLVGAGGKRPKKADLVTVLRQRFFTPKRIRASYAKLTATEKEVLNRVLLHAAPVPTRLLRRELLRANLVTEAPKPKEPERKRYWGYSRPKPYQGSPTHRHSTIFEDVMARLTYHGLVFSQGAAELRTGYKYKLRFTPGDLLYVPNAVRAALPEPTPVPMETSALQPDRIVAGDPNPLLRDLYLYWDYARRGGIKLLLSGAVGKRELKVLNGLMLTPDPGIGRARKEADMPHLYFLRMVLQGVGLLHSVSGRLLPVTDDPLEIPEFWRSSVEQQMLACLEQWETMTQGSETVDLNPDDRPRISNAHERLLKMISTVGEGAWFAVEDLVENIWTLEPDFLYSLHTQVEESRRWYGGYFQGQYYYGETENILQAMRESETTFIRTCLDDALSLLGVVDRGFHSSPAGDEETLYRLNPRGYRVVSAFVKGADALAAGETALPSDTGRVLIQPNFHLVAMGPVPIALLAQLDLFAVRLQAGVGAFEYELTRESVYQAQQNGMDAGQIRSLLLDVCAGPLPQNVDRTLQEWAQHFERIVFRTGVDLLHTGEPALLEILAAHGAVATQLEQSLTPCLALIRAGGVDSLVAGLKEAGHLPCVSDARPATADNSIVLDEKGNISLLHSLPSLYLEGRLAQVAERSRKGQWRLSQSTVRRCGGSRAKVMDLLQELNALSRSPLPAALVERIKAWGNYYGQVDMAQVVLMEFQSRAVLDELLALPALRKHLRSIDEKQPLAIADRKDVAQVKKILTRLGVTIKA